MWRKITVGGVTTVALLFGATADVVPVPDGYYVRQAPSSKAQFSKVERTADLKGLTEAHIIGSACYDQFVDPTGQLDKIRERIDCEEYWKRANIPDYPVPHKEGMVWGSYVTHLFDTPSGDLDEGYYAKTDDTVSISAAQFLLEQTPVADAAIALDATSDQTLDSTAISSLSWSHTVSASASTTVLAVGILMSDATDTDRTVTVLTFNGDSLFIVREDDEDTDNISSAVWQLPDPDLGAKTVAVTLNASNTYADAGALSLHGVDHFTPVDAQASSAAASGNVVAAITTVANNSWVFGAGISILDNGTYAVQPDTASIGLYDVDGNQAAMMTGYFGPQITAGAASTTWTCTGGLCASNDWISSQASFDPNCNAVGEVCSQLWRASGTWVAPANLTSVDVACWGAGGGGGTNNTDGGGGGGGGAFASSTVAVTGGNSYAIVVGTGGAADTVLTTATSSFNGTSVVADGGYGSADGTAGQRGLASLSTGTVTANGGAGGTAGSGGGGGGGGAGGPAGAGASGTDGGLTAGGSGGTGANGTGGAGGTGTATCATTIADYGRPSPNGGGGGAGGDNTDCDGGAAGFIGGGGGGGSDDGVGDPGAPGQSGACLLVWTYPAAGAAATPLPLLQFPIFFDGGNI